MTCEAKGIAKVMHHERPSWQPKVGERTNVKPWYSSLSTFKPGVEVVVIGANPAGNPKDPPEDSDVNSYQENLSRDGFNAYLHESWEDYPVGKAPLQCAVSIVFQELFGHCKSETRLLNAACFNVCPIRTWNTKERNLPEQVWQESMKWSKEVLNHLQPSIIICIGNNKERSSWSAITACRSATETGEVRIKNSPPVKCGRFHSPIGENPMVIGLPHLSWFTSSNLFAAIRDNRPSLLGITP